MATKPMKTLKLPGLDDTYTFLQNDTTLAVSGKAADAKATGDALAAVQAQVDGVQAGQYPDMGAGQLLSTTGTANPTPYTYRENASGSDRVTISQITGGTVAFNQLVVDDNVAERTNNGVTVSRTGRLFTVTGTGTASSWNTFTNFKPTAVVDHVYLLLLSNDLTGTAGVQFAGFTTWLAARTTTSKIGKCTETATASSLQIRVVENESWNNSFYLGLFDLTQMFGATVAQHFLDLETASAGAGVALFREMFPESYYPYNTGELVSVQTSGRKTVGYNLFDKAAATLGKYYLGSGQETNGPDRGHSGFIRVTPGVRYYTNAADITYVWKCIFFDSDKRFVTRAAEPGTFTFTAPAGAVYMAINFPKAQLDSLVVNISDPSRNGTYEPYSAHTYPLDSTLTLRGIPVMTDGVPAYDGDKYAPDGTVTRRFKTLVLNGTETWTKGSFGSTSAIRVYTNLPDAAVGSMVVNDQGYDGYYTGQKLGGIRVVNNAGRPILDVYEDINVYADANAWRAHLAESPMTIVYELATPTTETAAPYQSIQIAGSTEEFLPPATDTRSAAVPVGSVSLYQTNLRAGLETLLDTDLAHAESIAPVQGSTASTNISSGELLMRDGKLYKATQAIVAGAEIGSTNTTETTLAAQLAALEARIAALEN